MSSYHEPVMKHEIVNNLEKKNNAVYVDVTLGMGGHTLAIMGSEKKPKKMICIDSRAISSILRTYVGGLGPLLGPMLVVLAAVGPLWASLVLAGLRPKRGPNPSGSRV